MGVRQLPPWRRSAARSRGPGPARPGAARAARRRCRAAPRSTPVGPGGGSSSVTLRTTTGRVAQPVELPAAGPRCPSVTVMTAAARGTASSLDAAHEARPRAISVRHAGGELVRVVDQLRAGQPRAEEARAAASPRRARARRPGRSCTSRAQERRRGRPRGSAWNGSARRTHGGGAADTRAKPSSAPCASGSSSTTVTACPASASARASRRTRESYSTDLCSSIATRIVRLTVGLRTH